MHAPPAADHEHLADALRGPSPADAASSLAFWRARLERLPLRRVAARREARAMVVVWEERLRRAELERFGGGPIGRLLAGVAVLRGERPGAILRRGLLAVMPRGVVRGVVVTGIVVAVSLGVVLGAIVTALF